MMYRFRPILIFSVSIVLLAGALFGGLWYASKYNKQQADNAQVAQNPSTDQNTSNASSQKQQTEEEKKKQAQMDQEQKKAAPAPTPAPKPTPKPTTPATPKPAPALPQSDVAANATPAHIPQAGANATDLLLSSIMIGAAVFLTLHVRRQRTLLGFTR
jgi:outer membrane biosynthesis protein TonB